MLFRMPKTQPDSVVTASVTAGSTLCRAASARKEGLRFGVAPASYPPLMGNQPYLKASRYSRSMPRTASTGEPGISRGRTKFRVIAAHSVMRNSTTLRSTYLTAVPASRLRQVGEHREELVVVVDRQRVRVGLRRPPGEILGGEQAPAAAGVQQDDRHAVVHALLPLVCRLLLGGV